MIITKLNISNLRAIESGEFVFKDGFNLIVGVNGVGKSTVLDAIRICMSRIMPSITESPARAMSFDVDDIHSGSPFLDVEMIIKLSNNEYRYTRREWKDKIAIDNQNNIDHLRRKVLTSDRLKTSAHVLLRELVEAQGVADSDTFAPSKDALRQAAGALGRSTNCIFFSVNRSVVRNEAAPKTRAAGGPAAAYAEALVPRPWQVQQFADWMRVQNVLASENPISAKHIEVLTEAASYFLPSYSDLRFDEETKSRLLINHEDVPLDVSLLSDGERGVLAMVLDLARRLSQANPELDDPLEDGQAIVLIDEIDLHLHPKWQRQIVHKLTDIFPRCQFIATTHSPQIIGEVEHDRIQIIANGEVYSPTHSYGVDSSRVLEEIMEADPRAEEVGKILSLVAKEIGDERFDKARRTLTELALRLGENDPEVTRIRTLLSFMEGEE